ncbi:hypothetical protein HYX07_02275 [Candidatus Woesearchaeota archaeon]|nr:hypothetical protein [Candidatus Woesearchaeota archaeon]
MHIEVDQSGKIEQLNKDTVIAFSNKNKYSVLIPHEVKQEIFRIYKGKVKELRYRLFCSGVYFCLRDYIREKELITICCEYIGKENLIKSFLLDYLRKSYLAVDSKIIRFGSIGKKSNAHAEAIDVYRGNRRPNKILSLSEVEKCLKK